MQQITLSKHTVIIALCSAIVALLVAGLFILKPNTEIFIGEKNLDAGIYTFPPTSLSEKVQYWFAERSLAKKVLKAAKEQEGKNIFRGTSLCSSKVAIYEQRYSEKYPIYSKHDTFIEDTPTVFLDAGGNRLLSCGGLGGWMKGNLCDRFTSKLSKTVQLECN